MYQFKGKPLYYQCPFRIMRSDLLTLAEKNVLCYLLFRWDDKDGHCWPSLSGIGSSMNINRRTVLSAMKRLTELKIITGVTANYGGVSHRNNGYVLDTEL